MGDEQCGATARKTCSPEDYAIYYAYCRYASNYMHICVTFAFVCDENRADRLFSQIGWNVCSLAAGWRDNAQRVYVREICVHHTESPFHRLERTKKKRNNSIDCIDSNKVIRLMEENV